MEDVINISVMCFLAGVATAFGALFGLAVFGWFKQVLGGKR